MKNSPLDRDAKYTIALIANRHAIDPKRHYRKEERKPQNTPKLFQVGTVMSTSAEFYSSRLKRKEQRPNLAEEILSDERLNPYLKRKFSELQQDFKQKGRKALKKQQGQKTPKWKKQAGVKRSKKSR
ncbi:hypothetical protein GUITHDRAFT_153517 [Guillardia theta CCMP2712]|uniref:Fcf2 pre-rRNA processing C-terminal domain-containing protein n=1 Tax=Guillardia theta (strain CCMP2712) TaxID=905079 RepID=L1J3Q1_GUITC|nr:hypothetical protein GUITHDRAFT_153517 [Guillardia theta CCMP2712]EKX42715.1 hypothetical protein GUITHDRAFT_153517 [Guillardia theta CCMP2712]|mmetsp:Transcript_8164/g.27414  ORF Transcript_8164/g.27414 Transcript_8164/m.27414 type:complete len:127 (-) Transcript_8164:390-770(-)|eukprot:XP_005829695.1 hypothetical protein GUITHDRAFT_153517 [Guillardia theta CCMP2712]